jgi:hypothetical protein
VAEQWQLPEDDFSSRVVAQEANPKPGKMSLHLPSEGPLMVGRSPDGLWRCLAWLSLNERGELVIFRLELRPWTTDEMPSIGTDVLRYLPLAHWLAQAHSRLTEGIAEWLQERGVSTRPIDAKEFRRLRKLAERMVESTPTRPGRKGFAVSYYRWLALEYLELQDKVSRGIRDVLADRASHREGRKITSENIRDALHKATELGFLLPGTQGRAGRLPGPNLYEVVPDNYESEER